MSGGPTNPSAPVQQAASAVVSCLALQGPHYGLGMAVIPGLSPKTRLLSSFDGVGVAALALQDHVKIFQAFIWEVDEIAVEVCM